MLNNLKGNSSITTGGTNNIVVTGNNENPAKNFNANTTSLGNVSKNEATARAIAKGGY